MAHAATRKPAARKVRKARSHARVGTRRSKTRPRSPTARTGSIHNYRAALALLNSQTNYEKMLRIGYNQTNFNLSRMQRILDAIGNPHKRLRCIHVAGTKGKGSTCHMAAGMLQSCGYKVGLYTSPHVSDIRERIAINGRMVSESEFTRLISRLAPVVRRLADEKPTFFELITAAAFLH